MTISLLRLFFIGTLIVFPAVQFGFILALGGCSTGAESGVEDFIIKIDSLSRPGYAAIGDSVTIRLYGYIGPDGCYSFSHFEGYLQPLRLDLTVWGHHAESSVCTQVMIYMDGQEYKFPITEMGWFFINIHQPDGSVLKDSITIK